MDVRDRIIDIRRVLASELIPYPKNWRSRPKEQAAALTALLRKIGFADAVLAIETPVGIQLIDGRLGQDLMGDGLIPVLVLVLEENEADMLLATLDP